MPAPPRGEKPHPLFPEALERPVRRRDVAEAMPGKDLADERFGRRRVEHEVDFRFGLALIREGIVQQVVEDAAIHAGRLREFLPQPLGGRGARAIAHAHRQPGEFGRIPRHDVSLAVVENLKPMLDGPQQRVGAFEDAAFLIGQPARLHEPSHRIERRAGADLRRVAAAEKLEELDRELDVADPAAAVFDIGVVDPVADRPVFDPPLERLDAADVGPRQPAAVDPWFHLGEHPRPQ